MAGRGAAVTGAEPDGAANGYVNWTARTLDGDTLLDQIKGDLRSRVAALRDCGIVPHLGTIRVGEQHEALELLAARHRDCVEIGIDSVHHCLPADVRQTDVEAAVEAINGDPDRHGRVVQFPLPAGLDRRRIADRIDRRMDVFGSHPVNIGRAVLHDDAPLPCSARPAWQIKAAKTTRRGLSAHDYRAPVRIALRDPPPQAAGGCSRSRARGRD